MDIQTCIYVHIIRFIFHVYIYVRIPHIFIDFKDSKQNKYKYKKFHGKGLMLPAYSLRNKLFQEIINRHQKVDGRCTMYSMIYVPTMYTLHTVQPTS